MICLRQRLKGWVEASNLIDSLLRYAPDIAWTLTRTQDSEFWLTFDPHLFPAADQPTALDGIMTEFVGVARTGGE